MKTYRADLHVHSSHSNKPSYWALRKFQCPESYTAPMFIYERAHALGMDYVTITDHNTITGALEIAHLPGAFVSVEVTAYFPEDGCKVHVVALRIDEAVFRDLMCLRKNIYELVGYLQQHGIVHFIAHPLYAQNDRLSADHIERMLLLFEVFELKNGSRAQRFSAFMKQLLATLDRPLIERLADKHDLQPCGETPWRKGEVGGSDDHSGLFIGRTFTSSPCAPGIGAFLASVRAGQTRADGEDGGPLTLAHSLYGIGYRFYQERFAGRRRSSTPFIDLLFKRFFNEGRQKPTLRERVKFLVSRSLPEFYERDGQNFERLLDREARRLLTNRDFIDGLRGEKKNRQIFTVTAYLANRMIYIYTERLLRKGFGRGLLETVQSLSTIGLVHLLVTPYYLSFHHQHRSKNVIGELEARMLPRAARNKHRRTAFFTDSFVRGSTTVATVRRRPLERADGEVLTVLTCTDGPEGMADGIMNFHAMGEVALPEMPLRLYFPPLLDVIDFIDREGYDSIQVGSPGPMGLLGLLVARLLDIPLRIHHERDLPRFVRSLTRDEGLERSSATYIAWFYAQAQEVTVRSRAAGARLAEQGVPAERIRVNGKPYPASCPEPVRLTGSCSS